MEDEPSKIGLIVGYTRDDKVYRFVRRDPAARSPGR